MSKTAASDAAHSERLETSQSSSDKIEDEDVQTCDGASHFVEFLRDYDLHVRITEDEQIADHKIASTEPPEAEPSEAVTFSKKIPAIEPLRGCTYPVYARSGRRYMMKVSPAGSLEMALLIEAKALRNSKQPKDICLPSLISHCNHHMSSVNLLIMEFCERGTLAKLIKSQGCVRLHKQYIARIMNGVATALHFLHSQNIYHGTIVLSNILVDRNLTGRLTGLAWAQDATGKVRQPRLSSVYSAPEREDPKSEVLPMDMFSIGVVLYRALVGKFPKRNSNGSVDYRNVRTSLIIPLEPSLWRTIQLLLSERVDLRPTAGQLLHTEWIRTGASEPIKQLLSWNSEK